MNRITLFRESNSWMALHTGPHAKDVLRLFQTAVLPTAFTSAADSAMVLADIKRLNPDCIVELSQDSNWTVKP